MMASLDDSEPYQLKRKIIPGHIDVHPTDNAIIVNYSVQAHIVEDGGAGQPIAGDRKAAQKIIRIKTLGPHSNLTALAQEVVDKCKLIHPTKTKEVEQVLYYLLQRQGGGQGGAGAGDDVMSDREWLRRQLDDQKREEEHATADVFKAEAPSINDIESYIEGLYEEIPEKIKSTRSVLELARGPQNLDALVGNEALISALARVLREDNRKSTALNTNIVTIFYSFSQFQQFQAIITTHKVGDMCLRIVEMELKRFAIWVEDLKAFQLKATQNPTDKAAVAELDQETRKFQAMLQKQDQLLFVSFHLLLNLANDLTIEPKMVKRGIVRYLVEMLDRGTPELVVLGVTFLKRLCIVGENKDEIVAVRPEEPLIWIVTVKKPGLNMSHPVFSFRWETASSASYPN
ncbi:hypothetical protein HKX48_008897 [Thoreauomyces humboldtii]|nr:hypothetical protein HKX48_008897 [Thoreauomyces humboldtii]